MDLKLMATTFGVVFLAELGDKTQLAALALAGQSRQPWQVFLASSAALVTVTLLGVLVGGWLGQRLPVRAVGIGSAVLFIVVGVVLLVRTLTVGGEAGS